MNICRTCDNKQCERCSRLEFLEAENYAFKNGIKTTYKDLSGLHDDAIARINELELRLAQTEEVYKIACAVNRQQELHIQKLEKKNVELCKELEDASKAGTPYYKERDTMNGLIIGNHNMKTRIHTLEAVLLFYAQGFRCDVYVGPTQELLDDFGKLAQSVLSSEKDKKC